MMTSATLAIERERLRAIRILLEVVPGGERRATLIARARVAAASVRTTRDALARTRSREERHTPNGNQTSN